MGQSTLFDGGFEKLIKRTRKERFLDDMVTIISWDELPAIVEPFYPNPKGAGRRPIDVGRVFRIHF